MTAMNERRILHAHFHMPHDAHPDLYEQLLALAEGITPRVQAIPPDAAHLDITGALRYWGRSPEQLAALLRLRTMALHGVQTTCAIAPNRNRRVRQISEDSAREPGGTSVLSRRVRLGFDEAETRYPPPD
ncbi:hypothetical protein [Streptomyces sp. NBC_00162]|uniref:hypothetical protein n=1 Tax=Streptomyces sp. NBC_00162 TaxID=2903629 RepID=UPI00214C594A|nr:hypothetical protein [Streptomyces sp. NBC_00162]UUU44928.1 hypothetical protein JIW86_02180 [Streptomyces sp. NBC_00162]